MRSRDRAEIEPRPPRRSATAVHDATPPPCPRRAMFEADWTLVRRARKGFIPSLIASCDASLRAQRGLADSPRGADDRSSRPPKRAGDGQLPNMAGGELPPEGLEEIEGRSPEAPSRRHGACMRAGTRGLARRRPQRPAWPLALVPVGDTPGACARTRRHRCSTHTAPIPLPPPRPVLASSAGEGSPLRSRAAAVRCLRLLRVHRLSSHEQRARRVDLGRA